MLRLLPATLAILTISLASCAPKRMDATDNSNPNQVRLCVANQAAGYGSQVTVRYPTGRFVVEAGRESCHTLRGPGPSIPVQAVSNGGGSGGPLQLREVIPAGLDACWRWELYDRTTSRLLPCEETGR